MAFAFTCYGNDEGIEKISIYSYYLNQSFTVKYDETQHVEGFTSSLKFTAVPADGYSFKCFVYRLGSTSGTDVHYKYASDADGEVLINNDDGSYTFVYRGDEDIFIRAESNTSGAGGDSGGDSGDDSGGDDYLQGSLDYWDWSYSNGSASVYETEQAFYAVYEKTYVRDFSHLVWNDLVNKVMYILNYLGYVWNDYYGTYEETLMLISPYRLTADKFNALLINVDVLHSTEGVTLKDVVLAEVEPRYEVYGEYFLMLADCINYGIYEITG